MEFFIKMNKSVLWSLFGIKASLLTIFGFIMRLDKVTHIVLMEESSDA